MFNRLRIIIMPTKKRNKNLVKKLTIYLIPKHVLKKNSVDNVLYDKNLCVNLEKKLKSRENDYFIPVYHSCNDSGDEIYQLF